MPEHSGSDTSEHALIAQRLAESRGRIVTEWMDAVLNDTKIPSADRLTLEALRDHFPQMLDELIEQIRKGGPRTDDAETRATGRDHGKARWRSGYRLNEVLRELARIREMVIVEISANCAEQAAEKVRAEITQTVRRFFDTISATSAQEFVHAQDAEVLLRSTQLEHAYEQVQAATEQLRLSGESHLSLIRAVTHELRNALQPVAFAAQALLEETDASNRREIDNQLLSVAARLQSLLDRLVELSKILSGEARILPVPVSLEDLARDLETKYRPEADRKGLKFECVRSDDLMEVSSDPQKLRELAGNLLANAIKFTDAGFVRLEMAGANDHQWILRVTDSGSGMDPIEARHVFHEFHSRNVSERTGLRLGLILSRHLARLLGGDLTFQSTFGKGSSFEARLPRIAPARD